LPFAFCPLPFVFSCLLPFAFLSCGYVGEPLPPSLNIPGRVTDLRTLQRGDKIIVNFTIPELTTDGVLLKLGSVEMQAGTWGNEQFDEGTWAAHAKLLDTAELKVGANRVEAPAHDWVGRQVFFRVRPYSRKGRYGDWSEFAVLRVIPPLEPPFGLRADAVPQGVRVTWKAPQQLPNLAFRVRRRAGAEETATIVASVTGRHWVDSETGYGESYEYSVQAVARNGESEAESEISEPATVAPEDSVPPSVPAALIALAGIQSIELAWERNTEADLRGYRLYRSADNGPFRRIADLLETPSYSDRNVESGKLYKYVVSAVDRLGNESDLSKAVEIAVP
jgi:hypothetical protein